MYNNYMIPENNGLKEEIRSLLEWCEKKDTEGELGNTFFEAPIEESKMTKWEEENSVKIPDSYKEWLRFTEKCRIDGTTASFWGPDEFHSEYMPENLVVIGEVVGDGEVVCFSKDTGEFVNYFEGKVEERNIDFGKKILGICDDKPIITHDRILEIRAQIHAKRKRGNLYV